MTKILNRTIDFTLILISGIVLLFWYWTLRPYNPLEIKQPLQIINENKTVVAGELLFYEVDFEKNTKIQPTIHRRLIDGIVFNFPAVTSQNIAGPNKLIASLEIPHSIPPGNYFLESVACYQMNPVREICVEYASEEFEVIPGNR